MRQNQLLLRIVVFGFVALDTSGAGVAAAAAIGVAAVAVEAVIAANARRKQLKDSQSELR